MIRSAERDRWLPAARTSLVGRDGDVAAITATVRSQRLTTIVGQGGVGKTRVAIEVLARLADWLPNGAAFVDLAAVSDPDAITPVIAAGLGLAVDSSSTDAVVAALARVEVLVVLDNVEHLIAGAGQVARLLDGCASLRVLATSRMPLRLDGEHVARLQPLGVPQPALALLAERARAVRSDFALTAANEPAMVELCRQLDGLPLALELGAARLSALTPEALVARLGERGTAALGAGPLDRPARQRTMQSTIEWSHALLLPRAEALLARLSVFAATASLEAIEAVCAGGDLPPDAVFDSLVDLVDANLVAPDHRDDRRFGLHGLVRDFAAARLDDSGARVATTERLDDHAEAFVRGVASRFGTAAELDALDDVEREEADLRATLDRLDGTARGLTMAALLGPFWLHRGRLSDGRRHLGRGLAAVEQGTARAIALAWDARLASELGPGARAAAEATARDTLVLARGLGEETTLLLALDALSHLLTFADDAQPAVDLVTEAIVLARELGDECRLAELLERRAFLAAWQGDAQLAVTCAVEGLDIGTRLDVPRLRLYHGVMLSQVMKSAMRLGVPVPASDELVTLADQVGDGKWIAIARLQAGSSALYGGDHAAAARHFDVALSAATGAGQDRAASFCLTSVVSLAVLRGDEEVAATIHGSLAGQLPAILRGMAAGADATYSGVTAGLEVRPARPWREVVDTAAAYLRQLHPPTAQAARPRGRNLELTPREREVLAAIAAGSSNKDVAAALGVTPKTVMHHSVAIYRKLGVRGRAEAVTSAFRLGILELDDS